MRQYLYTSILIINSFFCFGQNRPSNNFICGHDIVMSQARKKNPKAFDEAEKIFNSKNSAKSLWKKNTGRDFSPMAVELNLSHLQSGNYFIKRISAIHKKS